MSIDVIFLHRISRPVLDKSKTMDNVQKHNVCKREGKKEGKAISVTGRECP
jgi:hypothetical protein